MKIVPVKKGPSGSIAAIIIGSALLLFATSGCTTTMNLLGYLKFWGQKDTSRQAGIDRMAAFSKQIRPVAGNPDSHYQLALHYQQRGRHVEAIDEFTKTVLIDPTHFKAHNGMGVSCDYLREFDRAEKSYRAAIELAPKEDSIYNNLGYSFILRGEYESAAEVFKEGIELNRSNNQLHNNLALALAKNGKYDLALAELSQTHGPAKALFALAGILEENGSPGEAEKFFAAAASLDPSLNRAVTEKDGFISTVSNSLKQNKKLETKALREKQRPARQVRSTASVKSGVTRTAGVTRLKPYTGQDPGLEADFLKNKVARVSHKPGPRGVQFNPEMGVADLVRQFFPALPTKERVVREYLGRAEWL